MKDKRVMLSDGARVLLRESRLGDAPALLEFINELICEGVDIARVTPLTLAEEAKWLEDGLRQRHEKNFVHIVAEVDGRIVAGATVVRNQMEVKRHVGIFGISVLKAYRRKGLARLVLETVLVEAKRLGMTCIQLDVFSTNKRAQAFYKKAGFKRCGMIPRGVFKNNNYVDDILMYKES